MAHDLAGGEHPDVARWRANGCRRSGSDHIRKPAGTHARMRRGRLRLRRRFRSRGCRPAGLDLGAAAERQDACQFRRPHEPRHGQDFRPLGRERGVPPDLRRCEPCRAEGRQETRGDGLRRGQSRRRLPDGGAGLSGLHARHLAQADRGSLPASAGWASTAT